MALLSSVQMGPGAAVGSGKRKEPCALGVERGAALGPGRKQAPSVMEVPMAAGAQGRALRASGGEVASTPLTMTSLSNRLDLGLPCVLGDGADVERDLVGEEVDDTSDRLAASCLLSECCSGAHVRPRSCGYMCGGCGCFRAYEAAAVLVYTWCRWHCVASAGGFRCTRLTCSDEK